MVRLTRKEKQTYRSFVTIGFDLGHEIDLDKSQPKVVRRSSVRIYQIVTGVTLDVGVPLTHIVHEVGVWGMFANQIFQGKEEGCEK